MKIAAKEVKVGQTVRYYEELIKVEKIEESFQKNGKRNIVFTGTTVEHTVNMRRNGKRYSMHIEGGRTESAGFGENTKVTVS